MTFDEQPDGDPHGECAAEIHRLQADLALATSGAINLVVELREALGLFAGAMPISPKQAWDEAIAAVRASDGIRALIERDQYRAGNTELLELLMKLCAGEHTAALHRARDILLGVGLMNVDRTLNWQALEDRKPKQQTWAEAVRECVTDPAEVERLLALDDDQAPP